MLNRGTSYIMYGLSLISNSRRLARDAKHTAEEVKYVTQNAETIARSLSSCYATVVKSGKNMARIFYEEMYYGPLIEHLNKNRSSIDNKTHEITLNQATQIWETYKQYKKGEDNVDEENKLLFNEIMNCSTNRERGQKICDLIYDPKHRNSDHWRFFAEYVNNLPRRVAHQEEQKAPAAIYPSLGV